MEELTAIGKNGLPTFRLITDSQNLFFGRNQRDVEIQEDLSEYVCGVRTGSRLIFGRHEKMNNGQHSVV
jgi:hypothetical protein